MIDKNLFEEIFLNRRDILNPKLITNQGWSSVIILGLPDIIQSEWLSKALSQCGAKELVYLSLEGSKVDDQICEVGAIDTDSISQNIFEKSHLCLALTTEKLDFVLFKDTANEYYILAGSELFMDAAYPITFSTAKKVYFGDVLYMRKEAQKMFRGLWETYARGALSE